jgi:hypothetical protein
LSGSCLELVGKRCPMLVTAWMELTSQYCVYSLARLNELVLRSTSKDTRGSMDSFGSRSTQVAYTQQSRHFHSSTGKSRGVYVKTMEIFENLTRLLQCVSEMREEEELDGGTFESSGDGYDGCGLDEEDLFPGVSATSSDQDDIMDLASSSSPSSMGANSSQLPGYAFNNLIDGQQHRPPRPVTQHTQRRLPVDPLLIQRWIAMESLASVLVETGLELCSSLAEILGAGYNLSSSLSTPSSTFNPSFGQTFPINSFGGDYSMDHNLQDGRRQHQQLHPQNMHHSTGMSASARAGAAIVSLTSVAGGGAMVSGTGGVGLIYVQFVVRLLSKIIEFSGQDAHQEQRLLVSLQRVFLKKKKNWRRVCRQELRARD